MRGEDMKRISFWHVLNSTILAGCIAQIGCGRSSPEHVNIVDFPPTQANRAWKPSDIFSDPQLIGLAEAIKKGDLPAINRLVTSGADVNASGKDGVTPLGWSLMVPNKSAYRRLLELGADPNRIMCGAFPIVEIVAGDGKDSEWLELALHHGGNPNIVNQIRDEVKGSPIGGGETPIFRALSSRSKRNCDLLIKAGANLDFRNLAGNTPLMLSATYGAFELVLHLLEAGADFRVVDNHGRDLIYDVMSAYMDPSADGWQWRERVVRLLEAKGVDFGAESRKLSTEYDRQNWARRLKWIAETRQ